MEALDAIKARRSVREYRKTPISKELIERIVECGSLAPTARGEEPWEFIVVSDRGMLKILADITDHGKFLADSACAIAVCCKDTKYYLEDGCAATENILIASAALGIGSCWIAGDKKAYSADIMGSLGVPAGYRLISIIAMGYPLKRIGPIKKRGLKEVLHRERF